MGCLVGGLLMLVGGGLALACAINLAQEQDSTRMWWSVIGLVVGYLIWTLGTRLR